MSFYVKISYPCKHTNQALFKSICYIGKYYFPRSGDYYKNGVCYLAKKVKGCSKSSVKLSVSPRTIPNNKLSKEYHFKRRAYRRMYRHIIKCLTDEKHGNREEAIALLRSLYVELKQKDISITLDFSSILTNQEKTVLNWARINQTYGYDRKEIKAILKCFDECDSEYSYFLRM